MRRFLSVAFCSAALGCPGSEPALETEAPATTAAAPASQPASEPARPSTGETLRAADRGLGAHGELRPSPADRCPVCAMRPAKNPKNAAGLRLTDGRTFYFCGNGCLLRAHRHPETYLGVDRSKIDRAVVLDYFSGRPLDAGKAHWVAGSDVVGPMGPAIVPLASASDAERFVARHGGEHRFRLEELDDERWRAITGRE